MDLLGERIGGCRIVAQIAEGGMGTVWKALTPRNTYVAVKTLHPESDPQTCQAFANEFKLCFPLRHKGLIRYLDYGIQDGIHFLLMELFEAPTLKKLIHSAGRGIVLTHATKIASQIASALHYLHEKGIIHRDVKPENILVNAEGDARLIDFSTAVTGFARWNPFGRKITGTPSYIAPELIQKKTPTPASDIYSFGATLFEMVCGRPPFVADSENALLSMHLHTTPPAPLSLNRDITPTLDKLLRSMLAKDPAERPPAMSVVASYIQKEGVFRSSGKMAPQ